MGLKDTVNRGLHRATGYELRKVRSARTAALVRRRRRGERLLVAPAFVLCTVRSGSTLLRVLLNSHPKIHSPIELHLRDVSVDLKSKYVVRSLNELGYDSEALEHLLWDRLLARELESAGKELLVNKTPSDVFVADRIRRCWPDSRFIFLLRHPAAIARSRQATRPQDTPERNAEMVLRYGNALQAARNAYDGLTVRYEDLTADPARTTRELCDFLGVAWDRAMLDYGSHDHGRMKPGLGDWKDKIKSGEVQEAAPPPAAEEIQPELRGLCEAWGYLPAPEPAPAR